MQIIVDFQLAHYVPFLEEKRSLKEKYYLPRISNCNNRVTCKTYYNVTACASVARYVIKGAALPPRVCVCVCVPVFRLGMYIHGTYYDDIIRIVRWLQFPRPFHPAIFVYMSPSLSFHDQVMFAGCTNSGLQVPEIRVLVAVWQK